MRLRQLSALLLCCCCAPRVSSSANASTYTIGGALGRRFDGVGAISGGGATSRLLFEYPQPQQDQILDYLFKPSFGAATQLLKIEIGGEVDSTNGAEASHKRSPADLSGNRGYEWNLMKAAVARNPAIQLYALAWGWPGYLRAGSAAAKAPWTNLSLTAEYVTSWVGLAASAHNLTINFCGLWNEAGYDLAYIPILRAALDAAGHAATQIVAADMYVNRWSIADDVTRNASLAQYLYGLGAHYPGASSTPAAQALGLPLWASEDDSAGSAQGGACLARAVNENYVNGLMTATITWHAASAFYEGIPWFGDSMISAGWPTSGAFTVSPALWAAAHTTQFTAPGWHYLAHGQGVGYLDFGGTYVALTDGRGNLTLVIEKLDRRNSQCLYAASPPNATGNESATFRLAADFAGTPLLYVWRSSFAGARLEAEALFRPAGALAPVAGAVTLQLAVGDVVTLTTLASGSHGNYTSPHPAPFPLPYADDFEAAPLEGEGRLWSSLSGAFEVVAAGGGGSGSGGGHALQQVTPQRPISWERTDLAPHTVIGDSAAWRDVSARVAVRLSSAAHTAALCVRCSSRSIDQLPGLWLAVNGSAWSLQPSLAALAAGAPPWATGALPAPLAPGSWHTLALAAAGARAVASVDGSEVAAVNTTALGAAGPGWVALATAAYGQDVMFDNFSVE